MAVTDRQATLAINLYNAMNGEATVGEWEGEELLLWEGSLSGIYTSVVNSRTYYRLLYTILEEGNFIAVLRRGTFGVTSVVALLTVPTVEAIKDIPTEYLTTGASAAKLAAQRVNDLSEQFKGLDVKGILAGMQGQINELRTKLEDTNKEVKLLKESNK